MAEESEDLVFVHGDGEVFNCDFAGGVDFTQVVDLKAVAFLFEVENGLRDWFEVLCVWAVLFEILYEEAFFGILFSINHLLIAHPILLSQKEVKRLLHSILLRQHIIQVQRKQQQHHKINYKRSEPHPNRVMIHIIKETRSVRSDTSVFKRDNTIRQ